MIICYESNSSRTILNKQFEEREEREEEKILIISLCLKLLHESCFFNIVRKEKSIEMVLNVNRYVR